MKAIRKYYFSNLCISFAMATIFIAVMKITGNNDPTGFNRSLLEFAGVLCLVGMVDYFLDKLEFKSWPAQLTVEFLTNYSIFMAAGYLLNWFGFRVSNIITITIIFVVIYTSVVLHTYKLYKQDEVWINQMLEKRNAGGR